MPQDTVRVHLPDGRIVNFPSTMSPAEMEQAISTIDAPDAPEGKSLGGFAENVVSSGGKFLGDIAQTVMHPIDTAKGLGTAIMNPVDTAKAIGSGLSERYGGLENIKETFYNDPVGVLADISSLTGAGAAAKVPKIAGSLRKIERLTNPLGMLTKPLAAGADKLSSTIIGNTLRPSAAVRKRFGGTEGVVDAVKKNRVFSEANAQKKLTRSVSEADQLIAEAQKAGVTGVPAVNVVKEMRGQPRVEATQRVRLGNVDERPAIRATAQRFIKENPDVIPLTEAQTLKRKAQEAAYEAGRDNKTITKSVEKAKARAFKTGIETQVPAVAPVNARSQGLFGVQKAFKQGQDRRRSLTNTLTALGGFGAGAASGDPVLGAALAAIVKGMDSPRAGAMTGIAINEIGQAGINPELLRAALIARLTGQEQE